MRDVNGWMRPRRWSGRRPRGSRQTRRSRRRTRRRSCRSTCRSCHWRRCTGLEEDCEHSAAVTAPNIDRALLCDVAAVHAIRCSPSQATRMGEASTGEQRQLVLCRSRSSPRVRTWMMSRRQPERTRSPMSGRRPDALPPQRRRWARRQCPRRQVDRSSTRSGAPDAACGDDAEGGRTRGCSARAPRSTIDRRGCRWARRGPAVDGGGDENQDDEGHREPVARRAQAKRPGRLKRATAQRRSNDGCRAKRRPSRNPLWALCRPAVVRERGRVERVVGISGSATLRPRRSTMSS